MDVKQEPFDPNTDIINMETNFFSDQMDGKDSCSTKYKTFKNDQDCVLGNIDNICEYQTLREFANCDGIKQECKLLKIEGSDFVENIKYESVPDNVNNFPKFIKKEPENAEEVKAANIGDIKPTVSEINKYVQFKNESELLMWNCDLPTLKSKVEHADYLNYFAQPSSSKRTLIKSKTKHTLKNVPKQKKRGYPWSVLQKIFRSSRKNLFNVQFGRCCEICYYCGQFFLTRLQFMFHFIVVHCAKTVTKCCRRKFGQHKDCRYKNSTRTIFRNPSTADVIFQCEICSKTFSTKRNLNSHLKIHAIRNKCEVCLKQFANKNNLKMHLIKIHSEEKQFACEICLRWFTRKGDLKRHLIIHTGEKQFACKICSKWFIRNGDLKRHLIIHTGEKQFACEICSKRFNRKSALKLHLIIHSEDKPFACEICSKRFTQKGDLKRHLIIHTKEKPFACEICSKQFLRISDLKEHLIIHNGEKSFTCEICSKWFTWKSDLNRHLLIHSGKRPFTCEICSKGFTQKSGLNYHLMIHSGKKPFACEICLKWFARKSNLKRHLIIHTGEKPFV